jgi:hypothetical protein
VKSLKLEDRMPGPVITIGDQGKELEVSVGTTIQMNLAPSFWGEWRRPSLSTPDVVRILDCQTTSTEGLALELLAVAAGDVTVMVSEKWPGKYAGQTHVPAVPVRTRVLRIVVS